MIATLTQPLTLTSHTLIYLTLTLALSLMPMQEKAHLSTHLENEIWALEILSSWPYAPQLLYKNMAALAVTSWVRDQSPVYG